MCTKKKKIEIQQTFDRHKTETSDGKFVSVDFASFKN